MQWGIASEIIERNSPTMQRNRALRKLERSGMQLVHKLRIPCLNEESREFESESKEMRCRLAEIEDVLSQLALHQP